MFYNFRKGLSELDLSNRVDEELIFGIFQGKDLEELASMFSFSKSTIEDYQRSSRTYHKMDSYYGYDFGLLHALKRNAHGLSHSKLGMYITANMVLVICDDETLEKRIFDATDKMNEKTFCLEHLVAAVLNCMIVGNLEMLESMETKLAELDEEILNNRTDGFNQKTRELRNEVLFLTHYYEQLIDVSEELLQDENNFFANEQLHHVRIFADRVSRLNGNVHLLKDYMLQIRESCQSQVDMNLNRIMYFFTVITTIFLPLTLIVGWYGMNFTNMPELTWQYGYTCVIIVSILIILACLWFFKKKNLLGK